MKRMNIKNYLFIICIIFIGISTPAWTNDAQLTDITIANTRDHLLIYMGIEGCFSNEVTKAIMNGVPATFSTFISLYKVRRLLMDSQISSVQVSHTIKYDPMKKEFSITRSWDKNSPFITSSFPEAQKMMSRISNLKIASLDQLTKGSQYQVRAQAKLDEVRLPFYLHYVLFFVSMWNLETELYKIDFVY